MELPFGGIDSQLQQLSDGRVTASALANIQVMQHMGYLFFHHAKSAHAVNECSFLDIADNLRLPGCHRFHAKPEMAIAGNDDRVAVTGNPLANEADGQFVPRGCIEIVKTIAELILRDLAQ